MMTDGEVLDLIYDKIIEVAKEVDEYMTEPDILYNTYKYNRMAGRREVTEEINKILILTDSDWQDSKE